MSLIDTLVIGPIRSKSRLSPPSLLENTSFILSSDYSKRLEEHYQLAYLHVHLCSSLSSLTEDIVVKCDGLIVSLKLFHSTNLLGIFVESIEMHSSNLQ